MIGRNPLETAPISIACPTLIASLDPALCRAVDIYCERTSASLDSELLNAFTNAAFLVASWAAWPLRARAKSGALGSIRILVGLIALTGLGSFLFHTVATRWAEWADVIPIVAFMLAYMWFVMTWLFGLNLWTKILVIVGFSVVTLWLEAKVPSTVLWGGALYLPTLFVAVLPLPLRCAAWGIQQLTPWPSRSACFSWHSLCAPSTRRSAARCRQHAFPVAPAERNLPLSARPAGNPARPGFSALPSPGLTGTRR